MSKSGKWLCGAILVKVSLAASGASAGVAFEVKLDAQARTEPATGRLVVFVAPGSAKGEPVDGPSFENPQPMYGIDVKDLQPGGTAVLDESAGERVTGFPVPLRDLPPGSYTGQARLDMFRLDSNWRREPGNMWSAPVAFTVEAGKDSKVTLLLDRVVMERKREAPDVEVFELRSELLSKFHGREIKLRAGVVLPLKRDAARRYPAVYEVPGFGGDHTGAYRTARMRKMVAAGTAESELATQCFWIVPSPESGNGHTLFADSANNGPWGEALVKELMPALEKKYNLEPRREARLLSGHSSGGWSTLWLAVSYPDTFGACWSSSPDPVDFTRFQLPDIYSQDSMYVNAAGEEIGSFRTEGVVKMTVREENGIEEVLGPGNTSGQQWDSWLATFGPRGADGNPAPLYDPATGKLDRAIAEQFRKYDINELVKERPGEVGLLFKERIRLVVGDQDSYYLNEAVARLKERVDALSFLQLPEGGKGYIKIVPGADHGTVFMSKELRAYPSEMLEWLKEKGLAKQSAPR